MVIAADQYDIIIPSGNRFLSSPFQMTDNDQLATQNPDQLADKIANIDLNKEPENAHEERLQNLCRFFLKADWLDDN